MAILESDGDELSVVRGNKTYHEFLKKYFGILETNNAIDFRKNIQNEGKLFLETIQKCKTTSAPFIFDEDLLGGARLHVFIKRIAINPVTKVTAFITVILGTSTIN